MLPKFELYMPDTLEEACRLKAEGAEVVAGGTDVFVNMHGGKDRSGKVVDIKNIPPCRDIPLTRHRGWIWAP